MNLPGAYLHIPFCAHRCTYCSFVALTGLEHEDRYHRALVREIVDRRAETDLPFDTVYFGGGTPSFVSPRLLEDALAALRGGAGIGKDAEITAEANPDDLDSARVDALRSIGVNRLSMGVQTLSDEELPWLERRHDAAGARRALAMATAAFPRVSADLMAGIPGQTRGSLAESLAGILASGVQHLSVYLLEIEKAPRLVALQKERSDLFPGDDELASFWEDVHRTATAAGFVRYELSNWALPGYESRHNLKYWTAQPTVGFGVSATGFDGRVRRTNTGSTNEYVKRVLEGQSAEAVRVELSEEEAIRESILLGLRLHDGVTEESFGRVASTLSRGDRERLEDAREAGLLEFSRSGRVRLTEKGVILSNEVFSAFV